MKNTPAAGNFQSRDRVEHARLGAATVIGLRSYDLHGEQKIFALVQLDANRMVASVELEDLLPSAGADSSADEGA